MAGSITRLSIAQINGSFLVATESGPVMVADHLTREEALGCIASWIYAHDDHGTVPQFMQTPDQIEATRKWVEGRK